MHVEKFSFWNEDAAKIAKFFFILVLLVIIVHTVTYYNNNIMVTEFMHKL